MHPCASIVRRLETDEPGVSHRRPFHRPPSERLIGYERRHLGIEFDGHTRRTGHFPVRLSLATARTYIEDTRHEEREVIVRRPELEDGFHRRIDRDRLLQIDGTSARPNSRQSAR